MIEFDQICFIFQHSLPCGPHTSSISVAALSLPWYIEALILILEKVLGNCKIMTSSSADTYCFPAKWVFMLGNRKYADGAKSGEYAGVIKQFKLQSHMSRTAATATTDLCAGSLSW